MNTTKMRGLSEELLLKIITNELDRYTLYNLCLGSSALYAAAAPVLYQRCEQPREKFFRQLLRTLLDRPDLALYVTHITIASLDFIRHLDLWDAEYRSGKWLEWKKTKDNQIAKLCGHPDEKYLIHGASKDPAGDLILLLLSRVPNLERLELDLPVNAQRGFLLKTRDLFKDLSLTQLHTVQLDYNSHRDGFQLGSAQWFLELPSLTTFLGHKCQSVGRTPFIGQPRFFVQHISLQCSSINQAGIEALVEACISLKSFELVYEDDLERMDFWRLDEVFSKHRNCLEVLILDMMDANILYHRDGIYGYLDTRGMKQLRVLDVPEMAITDQNGFLQIPAVEILVLRNCNPYELQKLLHYVKTGCAETIEYMAIDFDRCYNRDGGHEELAQLQNLTSALGIEFNSQWLLARGDHSPFSLRFPRECTGHSLEDIESEMEAWSGLSQGRF